VRQLRARDLALYQQYQQDQRIHLLPLQTYQGRVSASANGSAAISALVVARHLDSKSLSSVSDALITSVMDQQCVPYLRNIRLERGLGAHDPICPSDVHDYLVDAVILPQEYFAGAAGGNIMDPNHLGAFLTLLTESTMTESTTKRNSNGKAAATLFFREHVISIVKFLDNGDGASRQPKFDLIDSLRSADGRATRTRCVDADALRVLLQWYASHKFTREHFHSLDSNPGWDDRVAEGDLRVFQGYVWKT
jgi:hypothetical protein